jgi:hypothetical protein
MDGDLPQAQQAFENSEACVIDSLAFNQAEQLSAVFGDRAILARMREILADAKAPAPEQAMHNDIPQRGASRWCAKRAE